jgi:hypothetical protein
MLGACSVPSPSSLIARTAHFVNRPCFYFGTGFFFAERTERIASGIAAQAAVARQRLALRPGEERDRGARPNRNRAAGKSSGTSCSYGGVDPFQSGGGRARAAHDRVEERNQRILRTVRSGNALPTRALAEKQMRLMAAKGEISELAWGPRGFESQSPDRKCRRAEQQVPRRLGRSDEPDLERLSWRSRADKLPRIRKGCLSSRSSESRYSRFHSTHDDRRCPTRCE